MFKELLISLIQIFRFSACFLNFHLFLNSSQGEVSQLRETSFPTSPSRLTPGPQFDKIVKKTLGSLNSQCLISSFHHLS